IGPNRTLNQQPEIDIARISDDEMRYIYDTPVSYLAITNIYDVYTAYDNVLEQAGAIVPYRDQIDARIIQDVIAGTGEHIDSQEEVGGWVPIELSKPRIDSDNDGIPDTWEVQNLLNPDNPDDAQSYAENGYTWIEVYINSYFES
ncbi:MAG: hypothetical protein WBC91_15510, partial [Phototrophicaceae bacterium]